MMKSASRRLAHWQFPPERSAPVGARSSSSAPRRAALPPAVAGGRFPGTALCLLLFAVSLAGCRTDYQELGDEHVRQNLLGKLERREAIPFFEARGRFSDLDDETTVDRDVVLPLLKRLQQITPTDQWAVLRPNSLDWALALVVKLPRDAAAVQRMVQAVRQADEQYAGRILQQWGHEWLSLDLVDQAGAEFFDQAEADFKDHR
jgi:hypothetical protein